MSQLHALFMDAIREETRRLDTGSSAAAPAPARARLLAAAQAFTDDLDVLNYALTLEHLEYAFYRDGLAGFTAASFGAGVYDNLILVRDHEDAHVDALISTITSLGGTPVQEAEYDFGYADAAGFIAVAAALENTGVSAYDGAAASISAVAILNAAGQIVAVEARHAAYLNLVNGADPFPAAFETPLTRAEVLAIAGPFIVS